MNVLTTATRAALITLFAAGTTIAQVVPVSALQQPQALAPPSTPTESRDVSAFDVSAFDVRQPARYATVATPPMPATPASATQSTGIQQPAHYGVTTVVPAPSNAWPTIPPAIAQPATPSIHQPIQPPMFQAATEIRPHASRYGTDAPVTVPAIPPIQQPASESVFAERLVPPPATSAPNVQQPTVFSPPPPALFVEPAQLAQPPALAANSSTLSSSTLTNFYQDSEDEDDEAYDEDDDLLDDDDDDDDCGDDVDCGDEAECDKPTICGFTCGGWVEQGFTFNPYDPADGNNGTVVLNDLANQWQMNQLWFYMEREVDNGGCGWDWGGRFDVLYGTDGQYFQMIDGLEESWGQNGQYQVALLRFYYDVAYNDWTFRVGRFDTPVGYEPYDATESFFYSRSYTFYAQPGSLLGALLTRHLGDQLSVTAGLHRGDMQFDDTDGKNSVDFVGGFSWNSCDELTWVDAYLQLEEQGIGAEGIDYSVVFGTMLTENWEYVVEWYYGQTDQFNLQADWYGLNQHFMREINDCWSHGFRFEWFRDDDGFIITDFVRGNSAQGPFDGNFFEFTYAINYQPCENFVLRPEVRWDWYDQSAPGPLPFDDGTKSDQFLLSIDAIYAF